MQLCIWSQLNGVLTSPDVLFLALLDTIVVLFCLFSVFASVSIDFNDVPPHHLPPASEVTYRDDEDDEDDEDDDADGDDEDDEDNEDDED